jgi:AraC-like DNA-binding protein
LSVPFDSIKVVPQMAAWRFIERAAASEGRMTLGFECAMGAPMSSSEGIVGIPIQRAPTCLDVLRSFVGRMNRETTLTRFFLTMGKDEIWFLRGTAINALPDPWQVELYATTVFLRIVQIFSGPDWFPEEMRFMTRKESAVIPEEWSNASIAFGDIYTGFAIPNNFVVKSPNLTEAAHQKINDDRLEIARWEDDPVQFLKEFVLPYVLDHNVKIRRVSDALGMSVRTFQRELAKARCTLSGIVSDVRFDYARSRLEDPDARITDIAYELGYEHPGDFARAFSRRAVVSPRAYRKLRRTTSN